MNQKLKKYIHIILIYQNKHFKAKNSTLLDVKAVYKHHSNDIKIDVSTAIVLHNLNQQRTLPLFF